MTLVEHLEAAKAKLLSVGWGTGIIARRPVPGSLCLSEALSAAVPREHFKPDTPPWLAHQALCDVLALDKRDPLGSIVTWNDWYGRTEQHVVAALDTAIEVARGKAGDAGQESDHP